MKKRRRITKRCFALFLALLLGLNTLTVSAGEIGGGTEAAQESSEGSDTTQGGDAGNTETPAPAPEEPKQESDGANAATPAPAPEEPKQDGDGVNAATPAPAPGENNSGGDGTNATTPAPAPGEVEPDGDGAGAVTPGTEEPKPDGDVTDPTLPPVEPGIEVPVPPVLEDQEPIDPDEDKEAATYAVTFAVENPEKGTIRVDGEAVDASTYSKDVEEGSDFTFQAEAMEGWEVGSVSANGEEVGKDGDSYAIRGITGDTVVAVSFTEVPEESATYAVTFAVENPEKGTIRVDGEAVDASAYSKDVEEGSDFTFQTEAMEGWEVGSVSANGEEVGKDGDSYAIRGIAGDTVVAVSFTEVPEVEEELPPEVQAFLDAVARIPEEITAENVEAAGELLNAAMAAWEAVVDAGYGEHEKVLEAYGKLEAAYAAVEQVWKEINGGEDGATFDLEEPPAPPITYTQDNGYFLVLYCVTCKGKIYEPRVNLAAFGSLSEVVKNNGEYGVDADRYPWTFEWTMNVDAIVQAENQSLYVKHYPYYSQPRPSIRFFYNEERGWVSQYYNVPVNITENRPSSSYYEYDEYYRDDVYEGEWHYESKWGDKGYYHLWDTVWISDVLKKTLTNHVRTQYKGNDYTYESAQPRTSIKLQSDSSKNKITFKYVRHVPYTVIYKDGENNPTFEDKWMGNSTPCYTGMGFNADGLALTGWNLVTGSDGKFTGGVNPKISGKDATQNGEQYEIIYEPKWSTLSVIYRDGENEAIFKEQRTDGLKHGDNTPKFKGEDPKKDGQVFKGWKIVTGDNWKYLGDNTINPDVDVDDRDIDDRRGIYGTEIIYEPIWTTAPQPDPTSYQVVRMYYENDELVATLGNGENDWLTGKNVGDIITSAGLLGANQGWLENGGKTYGYTGADQERLTLSDNLNMNIITLEFRRYTYNVIYKDGREGVDGEEIFKDQQYPADGSELKEGDSTPTFSGKDGKTEPEKDGYTFKGWKLTTGKNGGSEVEDPSGRNISKDDANGSRDIIYVAQWEPKETEYTVVHEYYTNGNETPDFVDEEPPVTGKKVGEVVKAADLAKKESHGGNEYVYTPGNQEELKLIADAKANVITLRYDRYTYSVIYKDGADGTDGPKAFEDQKHPADGPGLEEGESTPSFNGKDGKAEPEKEGYTFIGWELTTGTTGDNGSVVDPSGRKVSKDDADGNREIIYVAKWEPRATQYTVVHEYYTNGKAEADSVDRKDPVEGKVGDVVKAADIERQESYGGNEYEYTPGEEGSEEITLGADAEGNVITLRYDRVGYQVIHEYYTDGVKSGESRGGFIAGKRGQEVKASDIGKETAYEGETFEYESADVESLVLEADGKDHVIVLRYNRTTEDEPEPTPDPEDPEPTPTPEDPEPTPTPEDPEPTPTPENPTPTPTPDSTPTPSPTPAPTPAQTPEPGRNAASEPAEPEAPAAPAVPRTIAVVPEVPAQADEGSPDIVIVDDEVPRVYFRTQDSETEEYSYEAEEEVPVVNELPETVEEDSPDTVILMEEDVPQAYVKVEDPVEDGYAYIPEEDVPLANMAAPQTGDMSQTALWLGALVSSLGGMVALYPGRRRRKTNQ